MASIPGESETLQNWRDDGDIFDEEIRVELFMVHCSVSKKPLQSTLISILPILMIGQGVMWLGFILSDVLNKSNIKMLSFANKMIPKVKEG